MELLLNLHLCIDVGYVGYVNMSDENDKVIWTCAIQYYKDGIEHVPFADFYYWHHEEGSDERNEFVMDVMFKHYILEPYKSHIGYCPIPKEAIEGYVYDGVRIKRTPENESEFDAIERSFYTYRPGSVKEIWRFSLQEWWRGMLTYTEHPDGKVIVEKSPQVSIN